MQVLREAESLVYFKYLRVSWQQVIRSLAWIWRAIRWIFATFVVGGILVGIAISLAIFGTLGLPDVRTWVILQPVWDHPYISTIALLSGLMLAVASFLAHRHYAKASVVSIEGPHQRHFVAEKPDAQVQLVDLSILEQSTTREKDTQPSMVMRRRGEDGADHDDAALVIDVKVRNTGEQAAIIKRAEFEVLEDFFFWNCVSRAISGWHLWLAPSKDYQVELIGLHRGNVVAVPLSQLVAAGEGDRFQFRVGRTPQGPYGDLAMYCLKLRLIYNESDEIAESQPFLVITPPVGQDFPWSEYFDVDRVEPWIRPLVRKKCIRGNVKSLRKASRIYAVRSATVQAAFSSIIKDASTEHGC